MTQRELQNVGVKLQRLVGWVDPVSGYHAEDLLDYVLEGIDALETPLQVVAAAKALLRREGFAELV